MSNLPQYEAILERACQLWPQRPDLKLRTKREDAMLEIMSALFDSFGHALVAHVDGKVEAAIIGHNMVSHRVENEEDDDSDGESYFEQKVRQGDQLLSVAMRLHAAVVADGSIHNRTLVKEAEALFNEIENWNG